MNSDYYKAIKAVWVVYSVVGMLAIVTACVIQDKIILKSMPVCYSIKHFGRECFMCGSTRSFIQFANGNFKKAIALNTSAFLLFIAIIINSAFFISFIFKYKSKNK